MFPLNPSLNKHASLVMWPGLMGKCKCVARRIVFYSNAISALRAEVSLCSTNLKKNPSRVVVVIGFIWKRLMAASRLSSGVQKPSVLTMSVNLRGKTSPPSFNSIGNMIWFAVAKYEESTNKAIELSSVVGCLQNAISEIDNKFVEELQGAKGHVNMVKHLENMKAAYADVEADYVVASSLCNAGFYENDFGWGEGTWLCHGGVDADCPALTNLIVLADTKSGGGIEVQLSLDEELICILESDPEMLSFASVNHCPL
ncbi:hypothetical protein Leryth_003760 [Lithospermum erythrorhizon]|nr:hypothetical protein Leryth_003760 [Lithospermum erythrorhizon]